MIMQRGFNLSDIFRDICSQKLNFTQKRFHSTLHTALLESHPPKSTNGSHS